MTTGTTETTSSPIAAIRFAAGTDIGMRREENQDSHGIIETDNFKVYVVADGMGGVQGGATASGIAIETIRQMIGDRRQVSELEIASAITQANSEIFEKGNSNPELTGMGTTCVGVAFIETRMFVFNVGDSRAYRIRGGKTTQLTQDHTLVMELVRSGALSLEQAGNHPVSHMLTRSLGPGPQIEVDCELSADGPARGDYYLLCSDGLYNLVAPDEFASIVESFSLEDAVQELIELANMRGGTDNITVILIEVGDQFPVSPEDFAPTEELPASHEGNGAEIEADAPTEPGGTAAAEDAGSVSESTPSREAPSSGHEADRPARPHRNGRDGNLEDRRGPSRAASRQAQAQAARDTESNEARNRDTRHAANERPAEESKETVRVTLVQRIRDLRYGLPIAFGLVLLLGFGFGSLFSHRVFSGSDSPSGQGEGYTETVLPPLNIETAPSPARDPVPAPELSGPDENTELNPPNTVVTAEAQATPELLPSSMSSGLGQDDHDRIERRRNQLVAALADLDQKITSFGNPVSSRAGESLQESRTQVESMERELDATRQELDIATRKLAVWFGRRKRLQDPETDPINLASEVSVTVPAVKEQKSAFEQATWSYLKEAEVLRYNPSDREQATKVTNLARARSEQMRNLNQAVRTAIDREVSEADRHIAELTFKRDHLQMDIDAPRRQIEYLKALMSGDSRIRDAKRRELIRDRETTAAELAELNLLLPPTVGDAQSEPPSEAK